MKLKNPRLWIGLLSTAAVAYIAVGQFGRTSPGPLAAVHARVDALQGWGSCSQCHGGWFESMTEACLTCHDAIGKQIDDSQGLHGSLGKTKAGQCARCHSDHHGADFTMVNRQSFAQAGITSRDQFDHMTVGFDMNGKHLELECNACHVNADTAILDEGATRFRGLKQDCATCHEDAHEGKMKLACAKCHGQVAFDRLHSLGHDEYLPLVGGHKRVGCRECHGSHEPRFSLEVLGEGRSTGARECRYCHESPHDKEFVASISLLVSKSPGASCATCHEPDHKSFRDKRVTVTPEQHVSSGFGLDAPHGDLSCEACHSRVLDFSMRYPGREADACGACHDDPHDGQFLHGPFAGKKCVACHDRHAFEPHTFTVKKHEQAALALTGRHEQIECDACHKVPEEGRARIFHGTTSVCGGCHGDAHEGFFNQSPARRADCAICHGTTSFSDVPEKKFDHGNWTGFAVKGAHAQDECEICHERTEKPDTFGRTLGRVEKLFGKFTGCVTCHKDPHYGEFDKRGMPRKVNGKTDCARCHVETSFRSFPKGFSHGKWTGFPVEGAHKEAGCAACHKPLRKPDKYGRTWERAKGKECFDCHVDSHAGQFRERDGKTSCKRCHQPLTTFEDLTFRHNLDSRFRLDDAHDDLACNACHKPVERGGVEFVRYRPLGRECGDCHNAQRDPLRRRKARK